MSEQNNPESGAAVSSVAGGSDPSEDRTQEEVIDDGSLFAKLKQARKDLEPFGKTVTLEVPGYQGLLAIEYQYIGAEVTEKIGRKINKQLRNVNGEGAALLGSIDTLIAACKRIMKRSSTDAEWEPLVADGPSVKFDNTLTETLDFRASNPRETVMGLFGSDHAIMAQNMQLSRWLTDVTRDVDSDFFSG